MAKPQIARVHPVFGPLTPITPLRFGAPTDSQDLSALMNGSSLPPCLQLADGNRSPAGTRHEPTGRARVPPRQDHPTPAR